MTTIVTGSRLHFGLFSVPTEDQASPPARRFGGVGLMVEHPAVSVSVEPAERWSATGPQSDRAMTFARRLLDSLAKDGLPQAFRIEVASCPPGHVGLGTGTQLALAVGAALVKAAGCGPDDIFDIARRMGRGQRSAIGVHGFTRGGFLVEAGQGGSTEISPVVADADFPDDWSIVLILPNHVPEWHGHRESDAFAALAQWHQGSATCDALCRLTLLGMLPALHEKDLAAFGEALYEFNRRVGEMFRSVQGGIYSHALAGEVVAYLRGEGVHGVGQSSWGPGIFAVVDNGHAKRQAQKLRERFNFEENEVIVTLARNRGAETL